MEHEHDVFVRVRFQAERIKQKELPALASQESTQLKRHSNSPTNLYRVKYDFSFLPHHDVQRMQHSAKRVHDHYPGISTSRKSRPIAYLPPTLVNKELPVHRKLSSSSSSTSGCRPFKVWRISESASDSVTSQSNPFSKSISNKNSSNVLTNNSHRDVQISSVRQHITLYLRQQVVSRFLPEEVPLQKLSAHRQPHQPRCLNLVSVKDPIFSNARVSLRQESHAPSVVILRDYKGRAIEVFLPSDLCYATISNKCSSKTPVTSGGVVWMKPSICMGISVSQRSLSESTICKMLVESRCTKKTVVRDDCSFEAFGLSLSGDGSRVVNRFHKYFNTNTSNFLPEDSVASPSNVNYEQQFAYMERPGYQDKRVSGIEVQVLYVGPVDSVSSSTPSQENDFEPTSVEYVTFGSSNNTNTQRRSTYDSSEESETREEGDAEGDCNSASNHNISCVGEVSVTKTKCCEQEHKTPFIVNNKETQTADLRDRSERSGRHQQIEVLCELSPPRTCQHSDYCQTDFYSQKAVESPKPIEIPQSLHFEIVMDADLQQLMTSLLGADDDVSLTVVTSDGTNSTVGDVGHPPPYHHHHRPQLNYPETLIHSTPYSSRGPVRTQERQAQPNKQYARIDVRSPDGVVYSRRFSIPSDDEVTCAVNWTNDLPQQSLVSITRNDDLVYETKCASPSTIDVTLENQEAQPTVTISTTMVPKQGFVSAVVKNEELCQPQLKQMQFPLVTGQTPNKPPERCDRSRLDARTPSKSKTKSVPTRKTREPWRTPSPYSDWDRDTVRSYSTRSQTSQQVKRSVKVRQSQQSPASRYGQVYQQFHQFCLNNPQNRGTWHNYCRQTVSSLQKINPKYETKQKILRGERDVWLETENQERRFWSNVPRPQSTA